MNRAPTSDLHADKKKILLGHFIHFIERNFGNPIQPRKAPAAIDPPQGIQLQTIGSILCNDRDAESNLLIR
jgi:hypothetical protein